MKLKMKAVVGEWKRIDNPMFWITSVSQLLVAAQIVLAIFGKQALITDALKNNIMDVVEVIITLLGTMGVFTTPVSFPINPVVDPIPVEPVAPIEPVVSPVAPVEPVSPVAPIEPTPAPTEPVQADSVVESNPAIQGPTVITSDIKPGPLE